MIDFEALKNGEKSVLEISNLINKSDLWQTTLDIFSDLVNFIEDCGDKDVIFQPQDPAAHDPYAKDAAQVNMAWTLAHVIVHIAASLEESTFLAAEMARGVRNHGRSRYETPWESMLTIAQCRKRLQESQRFCLASLELWPDPPHYEIIYAPWKSIGEIDARGRYLLGLMHASDHLEQVKEIIRQAHTV